MHVLRFTCGLVVVTASLFALPSIAEDVSSGDYVWPQWRGDHQNGVASGVASSGDRESDAIAWSAGEAAWTIDIPGSGGSTPVIAGDRAFLTSGVGGKNTLMAINTESGATEWTVTAGDDRGKKHRKGSGSNPSAVTDGKHVAGYFRSGDLTCVTVDGEPAWNVNLQDQFGEDTLWWDLGSSPALIDGMVVVAVMQTGPSYLVAYDLATGDMKWKADRMLNAPEEAAQSYSTPIGVRVNGESMIAVMGADHLTLHRSVDGVEVGRLGGFNPDGEKYFRSISSPVASMGDVGPPILVCPYARGATLTAVNLESLAAGQTEAAITWMRDDLGSDVPTPAIHDGALVLVADGKQNKGGVYGLSLETGETIWSVQLPRTRSGYSASPLIVGNTAIVVGEDARVSTIGPLSGKPNVIATKPMADSEPFTVASPVPLPGGDVLIRSRTQLTRLTNGT